MNLKDAKSKMATRRDKFVVGYVRAGNTVYGQRPSLVACTDPLSLKQAQTRLADMPDGGCAIFKLVPIAVNR